MGVYYLKYTKSKKGSFIILMLIIILILVIIFVVAKTLIENGELTKVYTSFTCNSCLATLSASDSFTAIGIKDEIQSFQNDGLHGQKLFDESVKLLGIHNIVDENLKKSTYRRLSNNPPIVRAVINVSENVIKFGDVSESKVAFVMKDITITNNGNSTLNIYHVGTSCSCLMAKFINEERESPSFGRFSYPYGMTVEIPPGESMRMRITYDSRVNSFFRGFEIRYVYIQTNDILMPTYQVAIEVNHVD